MCKINGKKLAEIRKENGMTQEQFAEVLGVSRSAIQNYEKERSEPTPENLKKICMILKISKDDIEIHNVGYNFLTGEGNTTHNVRTRKGFKRMFSPEETEKWISEKRTKTIKEEKAELKTAIKYKMLIGGKDYILIDPTLIHIPEWQRDTDMAKATDIAENFQNEKFDPIKIYIKNDIAYTADGGHRTVAVNIKGEEKIIAEVLSCSEYEAVLIFLDQQSGRKAMSVSDTYRAGVKANIKEYTSFKYMFEKHNIQITSETNKISNPVGKVVPSRTLLRLSNRNINELESILNLLMKLNWSGCVDKNAFTLRTIQTLLKLYANFGSETVNEKLMEHCKGAVYYESKVYPVKSNAELYDMLAEEITGKKGTEK